MLVISPKQFISNFLNSRSLHGVSGEPLFTYQMSEQEYQQLTHVVIKSYSHASIGKLTYKDWSACFVLWCSEWYRREYQVQDGWSWSGIWSKLDFELTPSDREDVIPQGLESFWQRPIRFHTKSRNFLGSVFIEGGLPFQLISAKENKFGDLIRKILANYYQVDLLGIKVSDLINRYVGQLPQVFSEDESIELISAIVRNLMVLVDKIDTGSDSSLPSEQLDKIMPQWRNQFPIPLDNATGKGLLDNWLQGAASATVSIKKYKDKLSSKHIFDFHTGSFISEISLPKKIHCNFDKSQVDSSRLDLDLSEGKSRRASLGSVFAQFDNSRTTIVTRKKGVRLPRKNVQASLFVDICDSGIRVEHTEIPNSSIPLGESPLGFHLDDGKFVLVGHSSFTTRHAKICVLCPTGYSIDVISGSYNTLGEILIADSLFSWLELNGDFRLNWQENSYRICTNSSVNTSGMLQLVGSEISWESKPASVYLGLPKAHMVDESTEVSYGLSTFINGNSINQLKEYEHYGSHVITVKNKDSDTLIRRKIAVLPSDLAINFKNIANQAEITISTKRAISSTIMADGCKITPRKEGAERCFRIEPHGLPPAKVKLLIQANLERDPIEILLPYPGAGIYGYNSDGKELDNELTINQLLGSELTLYSNKDYIDKFRLEFQLLPARTNSPSFRTTVSVGDKPQTFSLYSFKERIIELLSLSNNLDAKVQIQISNSTSSKIYTVRRFASALRVDRQNDLVSITSNETFYKKNSPPSAMIISEPERKPLLLQPRTFGGIEVDHYEIPNEMKKDGPWLLIPSQDIDIEFRPTFYPNNSEVDTGPNGIKSLQTAIRVYNPQTNRDVISSFILEMSQNIEHPSWDYLRILWDNFGYLPMSTFEVWKAVVAQPRALLLFLFKLEMNAELIRRLDSEFPILWELIRVEDWVYAKTSFTKWLNKLIPDTTLIDKQVNIMFERFSDVVPSYPPQVIEVIKGGSNLNDMTFEQSRLIINAHSLQELIREKSDYEWPTELQAEIVRAINSQREFRNFINFPHTWQSSIVLYPIVAGAIATNRLDFQNIFNKDINTTFALKKLRDFDEQWFSSLFSFTVSHFNSKK